MKPLSVGSTCFKDIHFGASYEEALEIAENMDIDFEKPKFHSDTRFANHGSKVFKSFLTDLPVIIERYKQIKDKNIFSGEQKKCKKGVHASNMLTKIDKTILPYQDLWTFAVIFLLLSVNYKR